MNNNILPYNEPSVEVSSIEPTNDELQKVSECATKIINAAGSEENWTDWKSLPIRFIIDELNNCKSYLKSPNTINLIDQTLDLIQGGGGQFKLKQVRNMLQQMQELTSNIKISNKLLPYSD